MAVTQIRKTSSAVLLAIAIFAIVVLVAFFAGGYIDPTAAKPEPRFTNLLLFTCYGVLALAVICLVYFAIIGFAGKFKTDRKGAMTGLIVLVGFVVLFAVTYAIGGTDPLPVGPDARKYNTVGYLKFSDMMLFPIYVMLFLNICALIWGAARRSLKK